MTWRWLIPVVLLLTPTPSRAEAEEKAIAYLAGEVPRWSKENGCFSCHNNGDGVRALYVAVRLGYQVPPAALADSDKWLSNPLNWDTNRGNPAFSDKKLARIQFAAALSMAVPPNRRALSEAADSLLPYQEADGSWQVDAGAALGSPVTYGASLATAMVRMTLEAAHETRFARAIALADKWMAAKTPGQCEGSGGSVAGGAFERGLFQTVAGRAKQRWRMGSATSLSD